jgi:hypothetical protein
MKKHLSLKPHQISGAPDGAWWYEETNGIEIYVVRPQGTQKVKISWGQLRQALKRKDKK